MHPQQALPPRVIYVATEGDTLIGYVAGHLTRRYACDGELAMDLCELRQRRRLRSRVRITASARSLVPKAAGFSYMR